MSDQNELVAKVLKQEIYGGLPFNAFVQVTIEDVRELKILGPKDNFHFISDIRNDEYDDALSEIIRRALEPVFEEIHKLEKEIAGLEDELDYLRFVVEE
jgi:hypothetical protein